MRQLLFIALCCCLNCAFGEGGLNYWKIENSYQRIYVLEVNPKLCRMEIARASDNGIGRESLVSIAKRKGAKGAVNAGFYHEGGLMDGLSKGALKTREWVSLPRKARGAIGWNPLSSSIHFDLLTVSAEVVIDRTPYPISGLNRNRKTGEAIVFTPSFHKTTLTNPAGTEILVEGGKIREILLGKGSTNIPENGWILSIDKHCKEHFPVEKGESAEIAFSLDLKLRPEDASLWSSFDYIVGGAGLLIYEGEIISDHSIENITIESFITTPHARSAVGLLPNGHLLFVLVEKTGPFDGMHLDALTQFFTLFGCTHALNLCGGESASLVYEGEVKNSTFGEEKEQGAWIRRVSDAILFFPEKSKL
ncbi:MAG: phosphodiester glycosidase family protein [Chlamydiota bacterium]